ncbi:O-antigen ligase-like membrane protein [Arcticibacter tournemirensis]|uniref:O-antigen ligase domain-containing protein n=1 Tax=Arcticibacter tournemirensis TaxID=699437 RepID=A0A5M9H867_9SPHI|nr:O-antigen ligase family protein [Arcticibacter tournemirensis]KAA8482800.1 O-antigen ligase domain-containing protein [Arcticibacter tournemirensis]TQM51101.1 O-antigen ligase-like membrane protein [Arcticibacter tournemirensis]
MDNFKINISPPERKNTSNWLYTFLRKTFITDKLANPAGITFLIIFSLLFALIIYRQGAETGILLAVVITGVPAIYGLVAYPKVGTVIVMIAAYFIMWIAAMGVDFPLGTIMDGLEALLILGFFISQKNKPNWSVFKNPIAYIILIWISYNIIQIANPTARSILPWIYTIRSVAAVMLMYFVFTNSINTVSFIRFILKLWIALSVFAALYALKQEYIGFFPFEERGLSDPRVKSLLFINGHWRKASIFSDPVAFSYNMVATSLLCISMLFGPVSKHKKIVLGILTILFMVAMLTSGTRGAYVLVPAALVLLLILNFNATILKFSIVAGVLFAALVFTPTSSPSIRRFQSAFRPSDDASFNVRKITQKRIQPFIQSHPIGAGLGVLSNTGKRMVPNNILRGFAPDSGYVRVAGELGWVGLLLFCTLFFVSLKTGISNYYKMKDPELKNYCLAMILIVFAFLVGSYPQEAIVQFPSSVYFCLFLALITVTFKLDSEKQHHTKNSK